MSIEAEVAKWPEDARDLFALVDADHPRWREVQKATSAGTLGDEEYRRAYKMLLPDRTVSPLQLGWRSYLTAWWWRTGGDRARLPSPAEIGEAFAKIEVTP